MIDYEAPPDGACRLLKLCSYVDYELMSCVHGMAPVDGLFRGCKKSQACVMGLARGECFIGMWSDHWMAH